MATFGDTRRNFRVFPPRDLTYPSTVVFCTESCSRSITEYAKDSSSFFSPDMMPASELFVPSYASLATVVSVRGSGVDPSVISFMPVMSRSIWI